MTVLNQVYKCEVCGNIVEVVHTGRGVLVCCGQPMNLQQELTDEAGITEKHLPVITKEDGKIKVTVGSVEHPMVDEHHIEWIELLCGDNVRRKMLQPDDAPEACFDDTDAATAVRAYCNLHGLWRSELR